MVFVEVRVFGPWIPGTIRQDLYFLKVSLSTKFYGFESFEAEGSTLKFLILRYIPFGRHNHMVEMSINQIRSFSVPLENLLASAVRSLVRPTSADDQALLELLDVRPVFYLAFQFVVHQFSEFLISSVLGHLVSPLHFRRQVSPFSSQVF